MTGPHDDQLQALAGAPDALARSLATAEAADLMRPPAPGKWSAAAVLAHLAETEIALGWRLRMMLTADNPALASFDQDAWASVGDYPHRPAVRSLALFRLLREETVALFERLSPEQWQRTGVHSERGPLSVADLAAFMVYHDERHLAQLQRALAAGRTP